MRRTANMQEFTRNARTHRVIEPPGAYAALEVLPELALAQFAHLREVGTVVPGVLPTQQSIVDAIR